MKDYILDELNKYVEIERSSSVIEDDISIDGITLEVAKRLAEAERKGLPRLLDSGKRFY